MADEPVLLQNDPRSENTLKRLRRAAALGDSLSVVALLPTFTSPLPVDEYGCSVLRDAVEGGHLAVASALIEHGEDVNRTGRDGWTPLMWAAAMGHLPVVNMLLQRGADLEAREVNLQQTALHVAADGNQAGSIALLIAAGVQLDARDHRGCTAYDLAVAGGRRRAMHLLIQTKVEQEQRALRAALNSITGEGLGANIVLGEDEPRKRL